MSGESLRSAGFTGLVDALEPSDNMYSIAEQKGIYSTRYSDLLLADKVTNQNVISLSENHCIIIVTKNNFFTSKSFNCIGRCLLLRYVHILS